MAALTDTISRRPTSATAPAISGLSFSRLRTSIASVTIRLSRDSTTCGFGKFFGGAHRIGHVSDGIGNIDRDDVGTLLGQTDCMRATLPACCTGDESDFSFDTSHVRTSLLWGTVLLQGWIPLGVGAEPGGCPRFRLPALHRCHYWAV